MKDEVEIMWRLYADNIAQGRHHETMRSSVTNTVLVIAGAVLTVIGFSKTVNHEHWPLTVFMVAVGLFGAVFVIKHYERYCLHMQRARHYRNKLESYLPDSEIHKLKVAADNDHKKEFKRLVDIKLSKFWVSLHLLVAIFGLILTVIALFTPPTKAEPLSQPQQKLKVP